MTRIIHKSTDKLISVKVWLSGICSQHLELSVIANVRLLLVTKKNEPWSKFSYLLSRETKDDL